MASPLPATDLDAKLGGHRMTKQRRIVFDVVQELSVAHPTAAEVHERAKAYMPSISLATVYNCLETLTEAGAITQVNQHREASRFCPNLEPHAHYFCSECQRVFDVDLRDRADASSPWNLPNGSCIHEMNVTMSGECPGLPSCPRRGEHAAAPETNLTK